MPDISQTALHSRLKSNLRRMLPRTVGSAHLSEAVAAGLGHASHAALLQAVTLPDSSDATCPVGFAGLATVRFVTISAKERKPIPADVRQAVIQAFLDVEKAETGHGTVLASTAFARMRELGTVSPDQERFLFKAVERRQRILVTGATASGKTTMVNRLAELIPWQQPVLLVEDVPEIVLSASRPVRRWEGNLYYGLDPITPLPKDGDIPENGWLVMSEISTHHVGQWALKTALVTGGALLATHPNITRNLEPWSDAECALTKVASWSKPSWTPVEQVPDMAPSVDAIVCMETKTSSRLRAVESCWQILPDWSLLRRA